MYATAQRVYRRDDGATGVNTFLHLHGPRRPRVTESWAHDDVDRIAYNDPGTLDRQNTELPSGGNEVRSYLDVVAPDGTPPEKITRALASFETQIGTDEIPMTRVLDGVAVRFSLVHGLSGKEGFEYEALSRALLRLLSH